MTRLRKKYSSKFKKQVALESIKELKTISEISSEYGVHPNQISNWKKQLIEGAEDIFKGKRQNPEAATDKTEAILYEEIGRLKVELDWLNPNISGLFLFCFVSICKYEGSAISLLLY